jgi:flavin-dependent dehydrogenase
LRREGILPSHFPASHGSAGETPAGRKGKMPSLREDAIALLRRRVEKPRAGRYRKAVIASHDIAVLGASAAGCATACLLAERGLHVALAEYAGPSCECPLADWAPRDFWSLPGVGPELRKACLAETFRAVRYHDASLTRDAALPLRPDGGGLVQTAELLRAMLEQARKAGAEVVRLPHRPTIRLGEDSVFLGAGRGLTARILLVAQGSPQEALSDLSLPVRSQPRSEFQAAALDVPLPGGKAPSDLAGALHLVASRQRGKVGMFFATAAALHVRLIWSAGAGAETASELSAFFTDLRKSGLVPAGLSLKGAKGAAWRPPAGEALDLETHAAKRCLLLGTAGGFADCITGGTLYPSVRSAGVAAEVAEAALAGADPQEGLMRFKNEWRKRLADSLRPPSTSVDMLLPLLLANRKLIGKFTRAMLYGRNI